MGNNFSVFNNRESGDGNYATPAVDKKSDNSDPDISAVTGGIPAVPVFISVENLDFHFENRPGTAVWRAVHHAKGYKIERTVTEGFLENPEEDEWIEIMNYISPGTPGQPITVTSAEIKFPFYFRVRSYNQQGTSEPSNIVSTVEFSGP